MLAHEVERRTYFNNGTTVAQVGFRSTKPEQYIPFGCPSEFAAMIVAAIQGNTEPIKRSFEMHPERRIETRSAIHLSTVRRPSRRGFLSTYGKWADQRAVARMMQERRVALLNAVMDFD